MFHGTLRVALGILGVLGFLIGILIAVAGSPQNSLSAIPLLIGGAVLIIAVVLERSRYRSESADRAAEPTGPGGGEVGSPEARFERTEEVFVDPTSRRRMRVYLDRQTGERRYRADS